MHLRRTRTAKELDGSERAWIERETGKHLADNQPVFIMYDVPMAPKSDARTQQRRYEALRDLITRMEQMPVTNDDSFSGKDHDDILYASPS